ncbi:hypothetical protein [Ramlibacter tataouinensis]|uniref:Uncharacterized protein n=1 Tax=Ramlibacter tataouinensis (strain ATCC BAA-407 / DSM 14655 / LMG 21543 / TTB310) TaxID=365046 RepID=F5Y4Y7_RAMTT|nr:hypothetical protein [Ramlibacter tataouinensis]AEG92643.1 hypothetical protein Rta_15510 [Ramlibacter tataouinensis TTB310]
MNEQKTSSILQRLPVILAVTAASYGLQVPPQALRLTAAGASTVRHDETTPRNATAVAAPRLGSETPRLS